MQRHDNDRLLSEPIYFEIAIVSAAIVQSLPRSEKFHLYSLYCSTRFAVQSRTHQLTYHGWMWSTRFLSS
jgi:hypothetical protein